MRRENEALTRRERSYPERSGFETFSPFNMLQRFREEVDRMFDDLFLPEIGRTRRSLARPGRTDLLTDWVPAIEVVERDKNLIVRADLPGINPDDIKIEVDDNGLTLHGETKQEDVQQHEGFYHSERRFGRFYRFIPLPENVNTDQITANFRNGLLEVTVPLPEQVLNRKQIQIQTEAKGKSIDVGSSKETEKKGAKA
ncbi:MAG: Hsp20/alpha crystallin family protein [Acidobacteriota bacterium]